VIGREGQKIYRAEDSYVIWRSIFCTLHLEL